jgi:hypothetical protein
MAVATARGGGAAIPPGLLLSALLATAGVACSSGGGAGTRDATGAGASGGGSTGAGGTGGADAGGADAGGADAGGADAGRPPRPFWCSDYRMDNTRVPPGWVSIGANVIGLGSGGMSSPILSCEVGAADWAVTASGTERDGIDDTMMSFRIAGTYQGPGRYVGTLAQGISVSFQHDDVGTFSFATVPSSDCELCINDDGLSGTVSCRGLESPPGSPLETGYIDSGAFTCPNAEPKPTSAPTDPLRPSGLSSTAILCHYLKKLNCPGRPPDDTCIMHGDRISLSSPCAAEWDAWRVCLIAQRPSEYRCGTGETLTVASGACETELAALRACRANDATTTPECDAFCATLLSRCGKSCIRNADCRVYLSTGGCLAATLGYLTCAVEGTALTCYPDGTYGAVGCIHDPARCN